MHGHGPASSLADSGSGDVVIEQPTTGEEGGLFIPDPAADDTEGGERIRDSLDVSDAGIGLGQGGIHRLPALDEVAQQLSLGALAEFGSQTLHKWLPLGPTRRDGAVSIVEQQLRQIGMVPRPCGQGRTRVPAGQVSQFSIEED